MEDAQKLAEGNGIRAWFLVILYVQAAGSEQLYNISVDAEDDERKGVYEFMFTCRMVNGVTVYIYR